jgi:hypothetical protein
MANCYVYYRVAPEREAAARTALRALLADVAATSGVTGRAFVKTTEPLLWMEVYEGVAEVERWMASLAALAERHGLMNCLADGHRHVEVFEPMTGL